MRRVADLHLLCWGETNYVLFAPISSSGVGSRSFTKNYPFDVASPSCAISSGYIYCIGGQNMHSGYNNSDYYATISSSGVGAWTATTSYPTDVEQKSCVISSGYIYCIGGTTGTAFATNAVYFAPISSSGVGPWSASTSYPTSIEAQSCTASSEFIYCVGGENTNAVYYAPVSSSGVGVWTNTTSYPTELDSQSCIASSSYIYCLGGTISSAFATNAVYYA